jgi:hypothetical protein
MTPLTMQKVHMLNQNLTEVRFSVTKYNHTKISYNMKHGINYDGLFHTADYRFTKGVMVWAYTNTGGKRHSEPSQFQTNQ